MPPPMDLTVDRVGIEPMVKCQGKLWQMEVLSRINLSKAP